MRFYTQETHIKRRDLYRLWIQDNYKTELKAIKVAFIFGSVARHDGVYDDCDLMICSSSMPGQCSWDSLRHCNDKNKNKFEGKFDLPLSVILLTQEEYEEDIGVLNRIKCGPKVNIY